MQPAIRPLPPPPEHRHRPTREDLCRWRHRSPKAGIARTSSGRTFARHASLCAPARGRRGAARRGGRKAAARGTKSRDVRPLRRVDELLLLADDAPTVPGVDRLPPKTASLSYGLKK
eukprot:scaffold10448_cov68-Phaeocystis_antarctica.AAC.1